MPNAFISYRRKPSSSLAHLLQKDLQSQYGFDIYLDTTRSDSAKVQFPERLLSAIDASDVFICLLADTTLESEWVLREIQRAFDGKKPCIPVFQESYQPIAIDHPAVDYLLSFDGVHVLDERGLYIDESVQKIGTLIQTTLPKSRRTALYILPLVMLVVGLIAAILLLTNGNDDNRERTTASHEAAVQETSDTPNPTATQTPTSTNTSPGEQATNTLSVDERAQATANAVSTISEGNQRATASEQAIRDSHETATALPLTQAAQDTVEAIAVGTRVVELQATQTTWTPTPTITLTPSKTPTSTPTATLSPIELAKTPVVQNNDWTVYSELDSKGVEMVLVPAGEFTMGSTDAEIDYGLELCQQATDSSSNCERSWFEDEAPTNLQSMDAFWIDLTEVTRTQYQACVNAGACEAPSSSDYSTEPNQPINRVTWYQAQDYCQWRDARLPSEAEWEFAARGPDGLIFPWGNELTGDEANHCDANCGEQTWASGYGYINEDHNDGYAVTSPVGSYPQGVSWVGALDMSGNVWEWTSTVYMNYPYTESDGREDLNLNSPDDLVLRGGSFSNSTRYLRAATRNRDIPDNEFISYGFRCVRSIN